MFASEPYLVSSCHAKYLGGVSTRMQGLTESDILRGHGCNPLSCVNVAVNDDGRLGALAAATPDVDTSQGTTLNRGADCHNLRLTGVTSLEIPEELDVVGIGVVCGEPAFARN